MSDRQQLISGILGYSKDLCYPTEEYLLRAVSQFLGRPIISLDELSENEVLRVYDWMSTTAALQPSGDCDD